MVPHSVTLQLYHCIVQGLEAARPQPQRVRSAKHEVMLASQQVTSAASQAILLPNFSHNLTLVAVLQAMLVQLCMGVQSLVATQARTSEGAGIRPDLLLKLTAA